MEEEETLLAYEMMRLGGGLPPAACILGLGKISFCNFGISEGPKLQNCKENCKKLLHCPGTVCCLEGVRLHTCTALGCYVCTYDHFHSVLCTCESPTKQHPARRPNRREVATTTTLSFSPVLPYSISTLVNSNVKIGEAR